MIDIRTSILLCLGCLLALLSILRRDRLSLGLPFAYLASLLMIHVPGAMSHLFATGYLPTTQYVETGIRLTAFGSVSFVTGGWIARTLFRPRSIQAVPSRFDFWVFCVAGGWLVTYGLSPLARVPTLGALIDRGTAIWMLGVLLALRLAFYRSDVPWAIAWIAALFVYPASMLLFGGFLSYGATAIVIVLSALVVSTRSYARVLIAVSVACVIGLSLFSSYFQNRNRIRGVVWSNASLEARVDAGRLIFSDFQLLDLEDRATLTAFDTRLNQNYFVGLAAKRLENGDVEYLYGRSIAEAAMAIIPRALWPNKPVFGGSGDIVATMTGLRLSRTTSWGVGNVMEFQINFGTLGVVVGFLLLGAAIGALDIRAAIAESQGDKTKLLYMFMPAVALIQPNGSMVELVGGAAAAFAAAVGWAWLWRYRERHQPVVAGGTQRITRVSR